ncbi:MAG: ATP-binding protein [Alphaproteobacteria bacterium]|nr:ATP-binding protein [Alphaproteobacteria bacterium]
MTEDISADDFIQTPPAATRGARNDAVLTEAVRHVDVIHTSLAGMAAIVLMLLAAVSLPVFDRPPVTQLWAFWVMTMASFAGITGLYIVNLRVHKHMTDQARMTEVLVNSLGQGFLFFTKSGEVGPIYSQACLDLLETTPSGKNILDVLRTPEEEKAGFQEWINVLFEPDQALSFDDVIRFFPDYFPHTHGRRVALVYNPIYGKNDELVQVVMIATDQTEEYAAREAAKRQQNFAEMICRIFKDRNQFQTTLIHVREFLESSAKQGVGLKDAARLQRQVHTLKATVKQFNLIDFGEVMHAAENDLRDPTVTTDEEFLGRLSTVRQNIGDALRRVKDEVSNLIGTEYEWRGNVREIGEDEIYAFANQMIEMKADPKVVNSYLWSIAAVPIRDCFHTFEREMRELASMLEKQIKPIQYEGENPHVLTRPMQEFIFSLTHVCRNIVDHGIESPVTRLARSKDAAGQVTIATHILKGAGDKGDMLQIVITDDGNGIDPARVRAKLSSTDPDGPWQFENDEEVIQHVFSWNFSTSDTVTDISGRGIGLEAVQMEVKKLNGTMRVHAELYKGTSFDIRIPYGVYENFFIQDVQASAAS